MKNKRNESDLSIKSLNFMLGQEEDLPMIGYWKVVLLEKKSENELYNFLLLAGESSNEDTINFRGNYVGTEIMRKQHQERDPLSLILKEHLLLENFIDEILRKFKMTTNSLSFKRKIDLLEKKGLMAKQLTSDVRLLNELRNNYAHNYNYDIGDFSIDRFSFAQNFYDGLKCKKKPTKRLLNFKTIQLLIFTDLLTTFLEEFPFLTKRKLKKTSNVRFYRESFGERFGKLLDKVNQSAKGTNIEWEVELKIMDTSKKKGKKN